MRRTMAKAKLEVLELGSGLQGFPENDIKSAWQGVGLPGDEEDDTGCQ